MQRNPAGRWKSVLVFLMVLFLAVLLVPSVRAQSPEGRKAISHPAPPYPELAKKYGVKGTVKVEVVIAPDGRIKEMKVIGGHPMLVASVEDTLRNCKFGLDRGAGFRFPAVNPGVRASLPAHDRDSRRDVTANKKGTGESAWSRFALSASWLVASRKSGAVARC